MSLLWSLRWRLHKVRQALRVSCDPGHHRFIRGECRCGHRTIDDPMSCPLF